MSAELLRRAAALMRSRAEAATPGPWVASSYDVLRESGTQVADCFDDEAPNADHIASWHPAVALAVADWLDACALVVEVAPARSRSLALKVARTYLGESA